MIKKISLGLILLVILITVAVFIANYPKRIIDPGLKKNISNAKLNKTQLNALHYILGIQYDKPLKAGKKIFKSYKEIKVVESTQKKLFSHHDLSITNDSDSLAKIYIEKNDFLSKNLGSLLKKMELNLELTKDIEFNFFRPYTLSIYVFKKSYFTLLKYSYLKDKNITKLKQYYEDSFATITGGNGDIIQARVDLSLFKKVHNFILDNKIDINTEEKIKALRKIHLIEHYRTFALNGVTYFAALFLDELEKNNDTNIEHDLGFSFLHSPYLKPYGVKKIANKIFFDLAEMFNIEYNFLNKEYKICFQPPKTCNVSNKKIFTLSSPLSKMYAQQTIQRIIKNYIQYKKVFNELL